MCSTIGTLVMQTQKPNRLGDIYTYIFWRQDRYPSLFASYYYSLLKTPEPNTFRSCGVLSDLNHHNPNLETEQTWAVRDVWFYNKMGGFEYHKQVQNKEYNFCYKTETNFTFDKPNPGDLKTLGPSIILDPLLHCPLGQKFILYISACTSHFLIPFSIYPSSHTGMPYAHVMESVVTQPTTSISSQSLSKMYHRRPYPTLTIKICNLKRYLGVSQTPQTSINAEKHLAKFNIHS